MAKDVATEDDVEALVTELARQHRAPRGVEQFGVEVVPRKLRTANWSESFFMFFAAVLNPVFFVMAGIAVVDGGLSYWQAIAVVVGGSLVVMIGNSVVATFGVDHGLPGLMLVRSTFGILGSKIIVSILRAFTGCYWFAFQTLVAALGISGLLQVLTGTTFDYLWIALGLALLQSSFALFGFEVIRRIGKNAWPLMLLVVATMFYLFASAGNPSYSPAHVLAQPPRLSGWAPFALWFSVNAGMWTTWYTSSSDFSRYGRSRRHVWFGFTFGSPLGLLVVSLAAAYAAVASGDWNTFAVAGRLTGSVFVLSILLGGLMLAVTLANTINLYTAGMSLVNLFPRIGRFWSTVLGALVAVGLSMQPTVVQDAQGWISELGRLFAPIAGVILTDYLLLKRGRVDVSALSRVGARYRYWHEVNVLGVLVVVIGYLLFGIFPVEVVPALATVLASGALYFVLATIAKRWSGPYRDAIARSSPYKL